jgi:hypothetical protein
MDTMVRPGTLLIMLAVLVIGSSIGSCSSDGGAEGADQKAEDLVADQGPRATEVTLGEDLKVPEPEVAEADEACVPACEGKECGPDGCGDTCGACVDYTGTDDDSLCLADGTCEESRDPDLEPDDVTKVAGKVIDAQGNPVVGLFVQPCTYAGDAEKCHKATTSDDGSFSLTFAPALKLTGLHVRFVSDSFTPSACFWDFQDLPFENNKVIFAEPFVLEAMGEPVATADVGSEAVEISADGLAFSVAEGEWFPGIFELAEIRVRKVDLAAHLPCFVPADNVPDALYAMTPDWLSFSVPGGLEVSFDNSAGLSAGDKVNLYVLGGLDTKIRVPDGDPVHLHTGDYYEFGTGTVSGDGTKIISDPGMGLPAMGWIGWKAQ